jgi:capsular polysaccharide biosynthesis protein
MRFIRRYLALLILAAVLGGAVAAVFSWTRPDVYRATTRLFFTTNAVDVTDVYQGTLAGQQRVKTYQVLALDPRVLADAVRRAGSTTSTDQLRANLRVDVPPGTIIMDLSVDNANPVTAAQLANAEADGLIALVGLVERPLGGGPPAVGLTVVQPAVPNPTPQVKLNPVLLGIGVVIGLFAGLVAALVVDRLRRNAPATPTAGDEVIDDERVDHFAETTASGVERP